MSINVFDDSVIKENEQLAPGQTPVLALLRPFHRIFELVRALDVIRFKCFENSGDSFLSFFAM
jgi:hypothetical protein